MTKLVKRREERAEQRAFVVEGPTLVGCALDAGAVLVDVFVDESARYDPAISSLLDRLHDQIEPWVLPAGTLDKVGDVVTSRGILGVVEVRDAPWPSPDTTAFVLVLDEVADPGNAGTLVRAATAAGAGAVVFAGGVDPTSPKVVRASAGAVLAADIISATSSYQAIERLQAVGYRVVGTVVGGAPAYDEVDLTVPVALVLGNEAHGLHADVVDRLDGLVTIPMVGATESLNVAMAGTVICFEILRQRRRRGGSGADLS
ncbi:MAG: RNA methyltransferase [Aquihabitans sp.]